MTYQIPTDRREEVEKLVAKFQKKAAKYGTPLNVVYGEPYMASVPVYEPDDFGVMVKRDTYEFEAFSLTIDGDVIRKGGYSVVAKVEHLDGGNIVTAFGCEAKPEWRTSDCHCDHCGTDRARKLIFIVRDGDGNEKQVGRSCLKDYCGIDPQTIGMRYDLDALMLGFDIAHYDFDERPVARVFNTVKILALAIRVNKAQGYVKSGENGSNKNCILEALANDNPTEQEMVDAQEMADFIKAMPENDTYKFLLDNAQTLINSGYMKSSHVGYIAFAPVAVDKYKEELKVRAEREAQRQAQADSSDYVGEIGQRLTFDIAEMKLLTSWESMYGYTYLYKFVDVNGNVLVWFASNTMNETTRIKATVKDHTERDGVKQTVITRCKAA